MKLGFFFTIFVNLSILLLAGYTVVMLGNTLGLLFVLLLRELPYSLLSEDHMPVMPDDNNEEKKNPIGFLH